MSASDGRSRRVGYTAYVFNFPLDLRERVEAHARSIERSTAHVVRTAIRQFLDTVENPSRHEHQGT